MNIQELQSKRKKTKIISEKDFLMSEKREIELEESEKECNKDENPN